MNKNLATALLILITFLVAIPASSQETTSADTDSIEVVKNFWGTQYYHNDKRLNLAGVTKVIQTNTEAYTYWRKGKSSYVFAQIIGFIGGALVGYELGKNLGGGGKINGAVMGVGGGLVVTSLIFGITGEKKMKKGIRLYNASLY